MLKCCHSKCGKPPALYSQPQLFADAHARHGREHKSAEWQLQHWRSSPLYSYWGVQTSKQIPSYILHSLHGYRHQKASIASTLSW